MTTKLSIFCFVSSLVMVSADWQLVVEDEFDGQELDPVLWTKVEEKFTCEGAKWGVANCLIAKDNNVRVTNGTLVMAGARRPYLNSEYIAPMIFNKQPMTHAKYEIRASLPRGKMLHALMNVRSLAAHGPWFPKTIMMFMSNSEGNEIAEIFSNTVNPDEHSGSKILNYHATNISFSEFNLFSIEVNSSHLTWYVNDERVYSIDVKEYQENVPGKLFTPFIMQLGFFIGVDFWNQLSKSNLTINDVADWECSLFTIDYVRIYQWKENYPKNPHSVPDDRINSSDEICKQIMPEFRTQLPKPKHSFLHNLIYVTPVTMIIVVALIGYFAFKQCKTRK